MGGSDQLYDKINKCHIIAFSVFAIFICSTPHIYYVQDLDYLRKEILDAISPAMFGVHWLVLLKTPFAAPALKSWLWSYWKDRIDSWWSWVTSMCSYSERLIFNTIKWLGGMVTDFLPDLSQAVTTEPWSSTFSPTLFLFHLMTASKCIWILNVFHKLPSECLFPGQRGS